jgi:hypothetical protein
MSDQATNNTDEPPPYEEQLDIPIRPRRMLPVRVTNEDIEDYDFEEDEPLVYILEQAHPDGSVVGHIVVRTSDVFVAIEKLRFMCTIPEPMLPGGRARGFIQPPLGGFPAIHQLTHSHTRLAVSPAQQRVWEEYPEGIFLKLFNPTTVDRQSTTKEIREFLITITSQDDILVSPALGYTPRYGSHAVFFVSNPTPTATGRIRMQVVWRPLGYNKHAFEVLPPTLELSDFIMSLGYLTTRDPEHAAEVARKSWDNPEIRALITEAISRNEGLSVRRANRAFDRWLDAVRAELVVDTRDATHYFNVLATPPVLELADWEVILHRLRQALFEHPLYGEGEHRRHLLTRNLTWHQARFLTSAARTATRSPTSTATVCFRRSPVGSTADPSRTRARRAGSRSWYATLGRRRHDTQHDRHDTAKVT